jgi:hypothetical protein
VLSTVAEQSFSSYGGSGGADGSYKLFNFESDEV